MGIIRTAISPLIRGGVGALTYYVRDGLQTVRQRTNNSNYGDSARRTLPQQYRRARWGCLVNTYRECLPWVHGAFEIQKAGQTDFSRFMALNIDQSEAYLTKQMCKTGSAVVTKLTISEGSLKPLLENIITIPSHQGVQFIEVGLFYPSISGSFATLGEFSGYLIRMNPGILREGDNLAFVQFVNTTENQNYPYLTTYYDELTLDSSSQEDWGDVNLAGDLTSSPDGLLAWAPDKQEEAGRAAAVILTRKVRGKLKVSTQQVLLYDSSFSTIYTSNAAKQAAAFSYGVDEEVQLAPGE